MNVYDFDGTIYDGDCTLDFYFYCMRKYPRILCYVPYQLCGAMLYKFRKISKTRFKEIFFVFLKMIPDIDMDVKEFWDMHERKIYKWYLREHKDDDVIISASPSWLIEEISKRCRIKSVIASEVDSETGRYNGVNCYGEEKVRRFYEAFPDGEIEKFYSDSDSDRPLAKIAKESFWVAKGEVYLWKIERN